jgi:hypothetical protein
MSTRRAVLIGIVMTGLAGLALAASGPGAAAQEAATGPAAVTLVHGLRGVVADVYVDGNPVLSAFEPERITDPMPLGAGSHQIEVFGVADDPNGPPLVAKTLDLPGSGQFSAVLHTGADGEPRLTVYAEDTRPLPPGAARVVVRHAAAAPAIDVNVDGRAVAAGLTNPGEAGTRTAPGPHAIEVRRNGAGGLVLGPQTVPVEEGTATNLYLVGSADDNTIVWLAQRVAGLQSAPAAVQTGTDGLAAPAGFPYAAVGLFVAAGILSASRLTGVRRVARVPVARRPR